MKKLYWLFVFCLGVLPVCSAESITMVTYFPVPYTSHQKLNVLGRCDVGFLQDCELKVAGNVNIYARTDTSTPTALDARQYNNSNINSGKLNVLPDATLNLNGAESAALSEKEIKVGNVTTNQASATVAFAHNVTINTLTPKKMGVKTTRGRAELNSLKFATNSPQLSFPACANPKRLIWQRLTIDGREGVYLTCANPS